MSSFNRRPKPVTLTRSNYYNAPITMDRTHASYPEVTQCDTPCPSYSYYSTQNSHPNQTISSPGITGITGINPISRKQQIGFQPIQKQSLIQNGSHTTNRNVSQIAEPNNKVIYSKIAMSEEDYQYIMHPNKPSIQYGYSGNNKQSKIAQAADHTMYPPHMQYAQYHKHGAYNASKQTGETYDSFCQQFTGMPSTVPSKIAGSTTNSSPRSNKSTHSGRSHRSSKSGRSHRSSHRRSVTVSYPSDSKTPKVAPCSAVQRSPKVSKIAGVNTKVAKVAGVNSHYYSNHSKTSQNSLNMRNDSRSSCASYTSGSLYNQCGQNSYYYAPNTNEFSSKIAVDDRATRQQNMGESRIAQPTHQNVQYLYCRC